MDTRIDSSSSSYSMDRFRLGEWRQFNDDDERKVLLSIPPLRETERESWEQLSVGYSPCRLLLCPALQQTTSHKRLNVYKNTLEDKTKPRN